MFDFLAARDLTVLDVNSLNRYTDNDFPLAEGPGILHNQQGGPRGTFFDGSATDDSVHLSPLLEPVDLSRFDPSVASGVFCYVVHDARQVVVRSDPLGAYPIYYYRNGREYLISNNLKMIEVALSQMGTPARRDILQTVLSLGLNGAAGTDTGIEGVYRMPPLSEICVRRGDFQLRRIEDRSKFYSGRRTDGPDRLRRNVAPLLNEYRGLAVSSALTGGVDSRLCMAALSSAGAPAEYWCGGEFPHPDQVVFTSLIKRFALSQSPHTPNYSAYKPPVDEDIRVGLARTGIAILAEYPGFGEYRNMNVVRINGYFGELIRGGVMLDRFRRFRQGEINVPELAESLVRPSPRFTKAGRRLILGYVERELRRLLDDGVPPAFLGTAYYVENRNRTHFGVPAKVAMSAAPYLFPLADAALMRHALSYKPLEVERGQVAFDLICGVHSQELAMHPTAEKGWHKNVARGHSAVQWGDTMGLSPLARPPKSSLSIHDPDDRRNRAPIPRDKGGKRTEAAGKVCQQFLREAVDELGRDHPVFDLIDREHVARMAAGKLGAAISGRHIYTMTSAFYWLLGKDQHQQRTKTVMLDG